MEYKDYYKTLGVQKTDDKDTIKKAYRKLAKKFHPDKNPGNKRAEERLKEINEAYDVLSNDEKRKRYDTMGNADFSGGFDPSGFSQQYSGGGFRSTGGFGGGSDFSDFFNMFFGDLGMNAEQFSQAGRGYTQADRMPDTQASMNVSIEDALSEKEMLVSVNNKKINLKIPKGIRSGQKIKMSGQGDGGGDLYIKIDITDSPTLSLEQDNIVKTVDIYPWQAYFGMQLPVSLPDTSLKVRIPPKIKGGARIRVRGKGYYKADKSRGDLYIKINIVNPDKLDEEQEQLYKELSKDAT